MVRALQSYRHYEWLTIVSGFADLWIAKRLSASCQGSSSFFSLGNIAHLLEALRPTLAKPVVTIRPGNSLELPNVSEVGTLVLLDAQTLGLADQHRLSSWLDEIGCRARVISTSRASVPPMIEAAMFLESLYYRLNTLHLDVGPGNCDTTERQQLAVHF